MLSLLTGSAYILASNSALLDASRTAKPVLRLCSSDNLPSLGLGVPKKRPVLNAEMLRLLPSTRLARSKPGIYHRHVPHSILERDGHGCHTTNCIRKAIRLHRVLVHGRKRDRLDPTASPIAP